MMGNLATVAVEEGSLRVHVTPSFRSSNKFRIYKSTGDFFHVEILPIVWDSIPSSFCFNILYMIIWIICAFLCTQVPFPVTRHEILKILLKETNKRCKTHRSWSNHVFASSLENEWRHKFQTEEFPLLIFHICLCGFKYYPVTWLFIPRLTQIARKKDFLG